jgi:thioredoxin 1
VDVIKTLAASDLPAHIESADDAIIFYHKELCPHCKNMEKVLNKFSNKNGFTNIYGVDSNEEPIQMERYGVERVPSLLFVKKGKVIHVKTGLLNPKELTALYTCLPNEE